jgi:hypothetical protein
MMSDGHVPVHDVIGRPAIGSEATFQHLIDAPASRARDAKVCTHPPIGATGDIEIATHGKIAEYILDPELAADVGAGSSW